MEHSDLEDIAQCMFGFVPEWSWSTMNGILAVCKRHEVDPAVYLRAFANNTQVKSPRWHAQGVILAKKWEQYIKPALQELETEAKVAYENDGVVFISALAIDPDPAAVLMNQGLQISAIGRVDFARKYRLPEIADKWMKSATREARANPCLAELYSFWQ